MSINKNYAVFGLGRYGRAVAKELVDNGAEVIAVDRDSKTVEEFSGDFPICKCADRNLSVYCVLAGTVSA